MSDDFIRFTDVSFSYPNGGFTLNAGSFGLSGGEAVLIRGANGGGKSTLGKLLAGIYKPSNGSVFINGADSKKLSLAETGANIGYLWQKCERQLFAKTVKDELLFVNRLKNPRQTTEEQAAAEGAAMAWLRFFGIDAHAERSSFFLSRGEKQRLALAAVISCGAGYLVLDEPTTGLDRPNIDTLAALLKRLNAEKGVGMSVISHDKEFARRLAARRITISQGEIIDDSVIN